MLRDENAKMTIFATKFSEKQLLFVFYKLYYESHFAVDVLTR